MNADEQILVCAVRYALGRRTYIVGVVCDYVKAKARTLSNFCRNIIIRDIQEELERYHLADMTLGDDCDEREWIKLLEALKKETEDAE